MKCPNCGANYRLLDRTCPYCGTNNALGNIWGTRVDDAKRDLEATRENVRKITPAYVYTRAIHWVLILEILLFVVAFIGLVIYSFTSDKMTERRKEKNQAQYLADLEELYQDGEWAEIHYYLLDQDIYTDEGYEKYYGVAYMYDHFERFDENRMELEAYLSDPNYVYDADYDDREHAAYDMMYEAETILNEGEYSYRKYILCDAQIEEYRAIIEESLRNQVGLTDDEITFLETEEYIYSADRNEIIDRIATEKGWR